MRRTAAISLTMVALAAFAAVAGCASPGTNPTGTGTFPPTQTPPAARTPTPLGRPSTPAPEPTCGTDPVLVTAGPVEAGLGHRALVLVLTNCGTTPYKIKGYPSVRILDAGRAPLPITVRHGSSYFGRDPGPMSLTLAPGATAKSVLAWSATVTDGDPTEGAYLLVAAASRDEPATYAVRFDLGTTGAVDVTAWSRRLLD